MPRKCASRNVAAQLADTLRQGHSRKFHFGWIVLLFALTLGTTQFISLVHTWAANDKSAPTTQNLSGQSRLSEKASVRLAEGHASALKLGNGHDLLLSYAGASKLQDALEQNQARPLALASADFDEDGIADLVGGYATSADKGIITINRGNAATLYPNSVKTGSDAPFLSPASAFEVGAA